MIVVHNVMVNATLVASVQFHEDEERRCVFVKSKGFQKLRVWEDLNGKFFANAAGEVGTDFLVRAKTPARAFAKAVKKHWSN